MRGLSILAAIVLFLSALDFIVDVEGAHCFQQGALAVCGAGSRCLYGHRCLGFCTPRPSSSRRKRSVDVIVSYKQPFVDMMTELVINNDGYTSTDIMAIIEELEDAVGKDSETCQSTEIESIRSFIATKRNTLNNYYTHYFNRPGDFPPGFLNQMKLFVSQFFQELRTKFESLDDDTYCAIVESTSTLVNQGII